MKKLIFAVFALLFSAQLFAAQTINFATEATYPPFESIDSSGKIQGFDIDIANALCQEMGATCQFSNQPFNSLIPSLQIGRFDAIIAALGVTPEREQQVAFTNTYYMPSGSFVAATQNHYTQQDVLTKRIGVQIGSTFQSYLQDKYGSKVTYKTYASIQEAFLDLIAGRIDAVFADTPIATLWLSQNNHTSQFSLVGQPITDATYFGNGYGIAVKKDNTTLLNALNQALAKIKANGTYNQIAKKYFGNVQNGVD